MLHVFTVWDLTDWDDKPKGKINSMPRLRRKLIAKKVVSVLNNKKKNPSNIYSEDWTQNYV